MTNAAVGYTIKLPQFEGPFDLLLFFIERDELDVYNIPIAKITDDFLAYIRDMEALNVDLASEFILVAATLCRIKAKLLIPRKPVDEEGNEIDPREELVRRLLEYKRYKSVLDDMRKLEEERALREHRGYVTKELRKIASVALVDVELEQLTLFRLLKTFERLVRKMEDDKNRIVHTVVRFPYTIVEQREYIFSKLEPGKKTDFKSIFQNLENRVHAIVTFLALLEMLNLQMVDIVQGEGTNNFWLTLEERGSWTEDENGEEE
ncbi:MAG TPA: chromosome segregation protein ScpA [Bacteroidetes bacterium]|nr:chromosome segregation protein ScpA [Bacteroidota bacterium]